MCIVCSQCFNQRVQRRAQLDLTCRGGARVHSGGWYSSAQYVRCGCDGKVYWFIETVFPQSSKREQELCVFWPAAYKASQHLFAPSVVFITRYFHLKAVDTLTSLYHLYSVYKHRASYKHLWHCYLPVVDKTSVVFVNFCNTSLDSYFV